MSDDRILRPSETLAYLKRYEVQAKKRFGQNFIIDNNIVEKIARIGQAKDQVVLEIGPGLGSLTQFLLRDAREVYAVEIDKDCVVILKERFNDQNQFHLIEADFLKLDPNELAQKGITHVIANLPYYITTPILFHLIEFYPQVTNMSVMVQKEVADRFVAKPNTKAYGSLSIILQTQWLIKSEMQVPPSVFYPAPKVSSSVVTFQRLLNTESDPLFIRLVKMGFAQRRKTLVNNLKSITNIKETLITCGFDVNIRAEALSPLEWQTLVQKLKISINLQP